MLTESCVVFFSPSRAVLSAILPEEYLTSLVLTVACEPQTHFRSSLFSLRKIGGREATEGEKRRPEMRLRFAGYSNPRG